MRHIVTLPDVDTINKYLSYNPVTGILSWKRGLKYAKQRQEGRPAGTMSKGGYLRLSIERRMYANHRIIWKIVTGSEPDGVVDHIDGNKLNNRSNNLRCVTQRQNLYNSVRRTDNTTGYKGVVYSDWHRGYLFNIRVNGKKITSPVFRTPEAANDYVMQVREKGHGEYACHGARKAT